MMEGQERAVVDAQDNVQQLVEVTPSGIIYYGIAEEVQEFLLDLENHVFKIYKKKLKSADEDVDSIFVTGTDIINAGLAAGKSPEFLAELGKWEAEIPAYEDVRCSWMGHLPCGELHKKPLDFLMFGAYFEWVRND